MPLNAMPNISFPIERQKATNWCWAAVGVSVSRFFNPRSHWRQCGLVKVALSRTDDESKPKRPIHACCTNPIPRPCNQGWFLEEALEFVGRRARWRNDTLSFKAITARIDAHRPVCVRIEWRGGGSHFVVISGYHINYGGIRQVDVEDPWTGHRVTVDYHDLVSNYRGMGRWTATYQV